MDLKNINFDQIIFGQTLTIWLFAVGIVIFGYFIIRIVRWAAIHRLASLEKNNKQQWYGFLLVCVRRSNGFLLFVIVLSVGLGLLQLPKSMETWIGALTMIAVILQVGLWINEGINFWYQRYENQSGNHDPSRLTTMRAGKVLLRLCLAAIVILLTLDNIPGVEITALVASLGIGGIAVALALQNILGDLFASLSIVLDKPFVVGDFIIVDSFLGTVENIGLKTTRLRSLSGEQLVFSNNDLLKSRIRNYKRMFERRVLFTIGVVYQTPAEKLERIPLIIREIIESMENTRYDRAHFAGFGDFALNYEIVYYVLQSDYNIYMDIQQAINLAIYRQFVAEGIKFAYPTRTLYVNSPDDIGDSNGVSA